MAWTEEQYSAFLSDRGKAAQEAATPKQSKYRNVKVVIDGEKFDSKREVAYWQELKLREKAGEISDVLRQQRFDLCAPTPSGSVVIAEYIADFTFIDRQSGLIRVQDVKGGKETALFSLKRKWLFLQSGIEVEVVR